jgi:hypothetical protein
MSNSNSNSNSNSVSVPNTLTIYVRTRLQDETKFKYKPANTILNYDGKAVYFNPLVKLSRSIIRNIPDNVSRNYLYTQFFSEKQFKGLLQRTLSNPSTAQPKRGINDPAVSGIIDSNIEATLSTLFSPNTKFYIGKNLYTIYSYGWEPGAWKVDTKKALDTNKRIPRGPYGYGYGYPGYGYPGYGYQEMAYQDKIAQKELAKLQAISPSAVTGKNAELLESANQFLSTRGRGVSEEPVQLNRNLPPEVTDAIVREQREVFDKLDDNPTVNDNFPEQRSLTLDPISISLFYSQQTDGEVISFEDYLKKYPVLESTFKKLLEVRSVLTKSESSFTSKFMSLFTFNKTFTTTIDNFFQKIDEFRGSRAYEALYSEKKAELGELFEKYIEGIVEEYELIIAAYTALKTFFQNELAYCDSMSKFISMLLDFFKKDTSSSPFSILKKMTKVGYGLETEAYKSVLKIWEDAMAFDVAYFQNISRLIKTNEFLKKIDDRVSGMQLLLQKYKNKKYNAQDRIKKYYESSGLLYCEEYQFLVYSNEVLLNYEKISYYIWKIWHDMTQQFFERSTSAIKISMNSCNDRLVSYEDNFTGEERTKLEELLKADKSATALASPLMVNALIKNDTPAVKEQKKLYSRLLLCALETYDLILYYSYLSEINCLRYRSFLVASKNVLEVELSINGFWKQYFIRMGYTIADLSGGSGSGLLFVPESLIIDVGKFTGNKAKATTALGEMQQTNTKNAFLLSKQIAMLKQREVAVIAECQQTLDLLVPTIEKGGVQTQCTKLIGDQDNDTLFTASFNSSVDALQIALKMAEVDFELTPKFNRLMDDLNYTMKRMLDVGTGKENKLTLDSWSVVEPIGVGDDVSLLQCICDAFNGQLILTNSQAVDDVYTQEIDEKRVFTVQSLQDGIQQKYQGISFDRPNFVIGLLEIIFQVKIIVFNLCKTKPPSRSSGFGMFQEGESVRFIKPDPTKDWQQGDLHISRVDRKHGEYSVRNELSGENVCCVKQGELERVKNIFDEVRIVESQGLSGFGQLERNINSFILLALTPDEKTCANVGSRPNDVGKYQLLLNSHIGDFVLKYEQIPKYIQFLIWHSVFRMNRNPEFRDVDVVKRNLRKIQGEKLDYEKVMESKEKGHARDEDSLASTSSRGGRVTRKLRDHGQRGGASTRRHITSSLESSSRLSYYVVVDLELYPGRTIPITQRVSLSCQVKKNNILELLSKITGTQFVPSTMYVFDPKRIAKYYNNRGVEQKKDAEKKRQQTRNKRQGYYSGNKTRSLTRPAYRYGYNPVYNPGNRYNSNYRPGYY